MTPFEAWYGHKPPVHLFCTFGCVAHVKNVGGHQRKLDDHSTPMVFIGYEPGSKAYRFYNLNTERVIISRDAVFDEARAWDWSKHDDDSSAADSEPFHVDQMTVTICHDMRVQDMAHDAAPSVETPTAHATPGAVTPTCGSEPRTPYSASIPAEQIEFASPPSRDLDLDGDHDDDVPLRFRTLENILGPAATPGLAEWEMWDDLLLAVGDEPATFEEARGEEC